MNVIKKIAIEMRPRLQSCNVALLTDSDFAENYHLKVSIRPNFIIINYTEYDSKKNKKAKKRYRRDSSSSCESYSDSEEETYEYSKFMNVAHHCKLIPSSLSSLKIESEFISFRVLTDPSGKSSSGTFFKEVIDSDKIEKSFDVDKRFLNLKKNEEVVLKCGNCSQGVSMISADENNLVKFERVLELPSDNLDMSDWFCHNHSSDSKEIPNSCHNNSSTNLTPRKEDLFYVNCHFLINSDNLSQQFCKFNAKRTVLFCNRCFFWLGIKQDSSCFKLWNSCVKFYKVKDYENHFNLFSYPIDKYTAALCDFLYIIKYGIKNSIVSTVSPMCKLLLECKTTEDKNQFMLIWVMDKSLDVLKSDVICSNNEFKGNVPVVESSEYKLEHIKTSKILYKTVDDMESVKKLNNDPAVQSFDVSKNMFSEGSQHLEAMAVYIPHSFKKSNDFFVTYLDL